MKGTISMYEEIDFTNIKPVSINSRKNKVKTADFAKVFKKADSFSSFISSLPGQLAGKEFTELIDRIILAKKKKKGVVLMMGAHVIKCGLSLILIDLMKRGLISAIAMNGAGAIHDLEIAYWGQTSEDVAENLKDGSFGMAKETAEKFNSILEKGYKKSSGFGEIFGKSLCEENPPHISYSILAKAYELKVPVTIHSAIGTEIVHQHPSANGEIIGKLTMKDFRIFANILKDLNNGGVVLNIGSAVILPEVFLKALTLARNIGYRVNNFTAVNFDMIQHYRPNENVVKRPTLEGGKGYRFTGHHEIMIPLLAAGLIERLEK